MKNFKIALVALSSLLIISCDKNDDDNSKLKGSGEVSITYDNGYAGNDLLLGAKYIANANGEALTVTRFNYIVSNFRLIDVDGNEFVFPKDESYFIISQEADQDDVVLPQIPAGEYTTLKFGLGIDEEKYQQGAEGQGDFITEAEANNMMWTWAAGYKYINFEGTFTTETETEEAPYKIHLGRMGDDLSNYQEVSLQLPTNVKVSDEMDSNIHLKIDAAKILSATTNIKLSEGSTIMFDPVKSPQVGVNASQMFVVDHIHNGNGH